MVERDETTINGAHIQDDGLKDAVIEEGVIKGKDKSSRHWIIGLAVALALFVGFSAWSVIDDLQQKDDQVKAGASVISDVLAACKDPELKKQLEAIRPKACSTADEAAEVIKEGPQGQTGEQGPPPTAAQVLAAVSIYCSQGACTPAGPTQRQVNAAVANYCAGGVCQGEPGEDATGEPGEPGASGAPGAQGEPGPGPSTEQIAAAVATYCAEGKCKGDPGAQGSTGPAGDDAFPFVFEVTVPDNNPAQEDPTYLYTCQAPAEEGAPAKCTRDPAEPDPTPGPDQP